MDNEYGARPCKPAGHKRTPWWSPEVTPEVPQDQLGREFRAQQETVPMPSCPCCGESRQDHLWRLLGSEVRCDTCGRRYKDKPMPSQDQRIAKLESRLDELRGWIQERADGVSNLGTRVAKLEDAAQEWRNRQHGINRDIYRDMHRYDDKLGRARKSGDDAMDQRIQARAIELEHKVDAVAENTHLLEGIINIQDNHIAKLTAQVDSLLAAVPSAGKPMIQEQCDGSWTQEESRAFYEGTKLLGEAVEAAQEAEEDNDE